MKEQFLYSEELWNRFCKKFGTSKEEFQLKTYIHLDPFFNFFKDSEEIRKLVADPTGESIARHSFLPFVKFLSKTPRYRWQENEKEYGLETKVRPIAYAAHFDSYIYAFYSFALTEIYQAYIKEKGFSDSILAYRSDLEGKCNIQFAKEVFDSISKKISLKKNCTAIALDIKGYFDNIDHLILKEKWCRVLKVSELPKDQYKIYRSLTKYSYVNKESILTHFNIDVEAAKREKKGPQNFCDLIDDKIAGPGFIDKLNLIRERNLFSNNKTPYGIRGKGIPQGAPLSSLLSNVYLIDFDEWLTQLGQKEDFIYRRYCDDLIVICDSEDALRLKDLVLREILLKYKVEIQDKKAELIEFKPNSKGKFRAFNRKEIELKKVTLKRTNEQQYYKNLQYLGFEFNGQYIYIRPGSLSRYFRKMKGRIVKTLMMAYSDRSKVDRIKRRQIYFKYSHFGPHNFITYVQRAAKEFYENSAGIKQPGMNSSSIKRQIASHVEIIERTISKKSWAFYERREESRKRLTAIGKNKKYMPPKF